MIRDFDFNISLVECPPEVQEVRGSNPGRDMSVSGCFIEGWRESWSSSSIVVTLTRFKHRDLQVPDNSTRNPSSNGGCRAFAIQPQPWLSSSIVVTKGDSNMGTCKCLIIQMQTTRKCWLFCLHSCLRSWY